MDFRNDNCQIDITATISCIHGPAIAASKRPIAPRAVISKLLSVEIVPLGVSTEEQALRIMEINIKYRIFLL
jgi:hypothetical protein